MKDDRASDLEADRREGCKSREQHNMVIKKVHRTDTNNPQRIEILKFL